MDDDNGVSRLDGALAGLLASVLPDALQRGTVDEDRAMQLKAGRTGDIFAATRRFDDARRASLATCGIS